MQCEIKPYRICGCTCRPCAFDEHCGKHETDCHHPCIGKRRPWQEPGMKCFRGYRPSPPGSYIEKGIGNGGTTPDYEGIISSDGKVAVRWLTRYRSWAFFETWGDFSRVHGHPDYGTRIEWLSFATEEEISARGAVNRTEQPPAPAPGRGGKNGLSDLCPAGREQPGDAEPEHAADHRAPAEPGRGDRGAVGGAGQPAGPADGGAHGERDDPADRAHDAAEAGAGHRGEAEAIADLAASMTYEEARHFIGRTS